MVEVDVEAMADDTNAGQVSRIERLPDFTLPSASDRVVPGVLRGCAIRRLVVRVGDLSVREAGMSLPACRTR